MTSKSCIGLAVVCPDLKCQRCGAPLQTWVWKEKLIFICPDCNEMGFNVEGMNIRKDRLPERSYMISVDWPCSISDPGCIEKREMLIIDDYDSLDYGARPDISGESYDSFTDMQNTIGRVFDRIMDMIFET